MKREEEEEEEKEVKAIDPRDDATERSNREKKRRKKKNIYIYIKEGEDSQQRHRKSSYTDSNERRRHFVDANEKQPVIFETISTLLFLDPALLIIIDDWKRHFNKRIRGYYKPP